MPHWLYLSIAIVAEVIGTSFLKGTEGFSRFWPTAVVVVSYLLAFYFMSLTLEKIPVGIAYAVWSGVGVSLIALIGYAFLGQSLDLPALVGIALIVAGVVVINLMSDTVRH